MCGSMVDIQSATADIRRGKKEERRRKKKPQDENITSASATQGGHKKGREGRTKAQAEPYATGVIRSDA